MSENQEKSASDQFEDGLRQILSPESKGATKQAARPEPRPTRRLQETVDKMESERKTLFWLKLLRPIAVITLIGLMTLFVLRITAER